MKDFRFKDFRDHKKDRDQMCAYIVLMMLMLAALFLVKVTLFQ